MTADLLYPFFRSLPVEEQRRLSQMIQKHLSDCNRPASKKETITQAEADAFILNTVFLQH